MKVKNHAAVITGGGSGMGAETARRLDAFGVETAEDVRRPGETLVRFSAELSGPEAALKRFLSEKVYRSETVMRPVRLAETIIADLFDAFTADPATMPEEWGRGFEPSDAHRIARRAADYIAGMTDRYAVSEHARLFDETPDLG